MHFFVNCFPGNFILKRHIRPYFAPTLDSQVCSVPHHIDRQASKKNPQTFATRVRDSEFKAAFKRKYQETLRRIMVLSQQVIHTTLLTSALHNAVTGS